MKIKKTICQLNVMHNLRFITLAVKNTFFPIRKKYNWF